MLDFRNTNTLWASIFVETLARLGLQTAIICPGSRSTPLTIAFAHHPNIESIPVLDERSAAFFALGIAKKTAIPTALVCTSGTAAANFYPAIIEAKESRIPLLILTADRPPELRDCHSGQTIDQVKIYGHYPNWQTELATPSAEIPLLNYLRQTVSYAYEKTLLPIRGPVHLNIPFRDPLFPLPQPAIQALESNFKTEEFFNSTQFLNETVFLPANFESDVIYQKWKQTESGLIIAGVAETKNPLQYCEAIAKLSAFLQWPVLAEGLSPLRNYQDKNPYLISTYDLILRNRQLAEKLKPTVIIQIGDLPTSKELRQWLQQCQPLHFIIDPTYQNLNSLHGQTINLRFTLNNIVDKLPTLIDYFPAKKTEYLQSWCQAETKIRSQLDQKIAEINWLFEGKISWILSQVLPRNTPLFISNSMPVRDVEFFWKPNNLEIQPYFNRGANGIDGILSTALGIAHRNQSTVLLTGDLALLHDTNAFLLRSKLAGHLTIILINNNGGGIFEMLPVSQFDPPFEEYFATPQNINFAQLCATYSVEHQLITSWQQLEKLLNPIPEAGIRVLEIQTNRKIDSQWRKENLNKIAQNGS
ncbi:2-succinyl-5-enolpyruvyl-6-hydroxy-3-cyclohexene-1-carboxylic-acid synthase [Ancylothrix sp. C2]|uniref:2-succinyl-5-enolpyruvyl-6-hydroxy-3- cyclohexene-1-carboxylic-acid synthase n=1 Tax=Ancylothrix sp. D3o TaxID=2953691 RepID=UPI0021BAD41A|nr:2-succinyl-5-enolpyruvyl-6-hydroxy-3-cyclohexene-1-carboxylic-acid synthase [Ancylothrix sp. D3o]MCT7948779.1 2-succinyl-5-enolpyruvyl-6-hydroxy-3-cyclohexene-1-carboxylic-acid synthase [Ancylothrix sp. D3o]